MELNNFNDTMCEPATFMIIGVGSQGCAIINTAPAKELLTAANLISCVAIATDAATLEACTAEHKICIPEIVLSSDNVLSFFWDVLPDADMIFVVTGDDSEADITISSYMAKYLLAKQSTVLGMALLPRNCEQKGYEAFTPLLTSTTATHMIPCEEAHISIVKTLQCIVDTITAEGMISIDFADVYTVFDSSYSMIQQDWPFVLQSCIGYGIGKGDEKSQRAELATKQALQKLSLPKGKTCKDVHAVLYSIRANYELLGDEINTIGEIIGESVAEDANIIFSVLFVDDADSLEVQLIAVYGEKI